MSSKERNVGYGIAIAATIIGGLFIGSRLASAGAVKPPPGGGMLTAEDCHVQQGTGYMDNFDDLIAMWLNFGMANWQMPAFVLGGIPVQFVLKGQIFHESNFDPGAVSCNCGSCSGGPFPCHCPSGKTSAMDVGLGQIDTGDCNFPGLQDALGLSPQQIKTDVNAMIEAMVWIDSPAGQNSFGSHSNLDAYCGCACSGCSWGASGNQGPPCYADCVIFVAQAMENCHNAGTSCP